MIPNKQIEVFNISGMQAVLNALCELCDLWLKYIDFQGEYILTSHRRESCEFCRLIRSTPKGLARCRSSALKCLKRHVGSMKPYSYQCHAGLKQLAVPVVLKGEQVGALVCGEIAVEDDTIEKVLALTEDLDVDSEELLRAYKNIPRWNNGKMDMVNQLLGAMGYCLAQINETVSNEEKLRLENTLKVMELKALQSQINPHFLFNTLNIISMLAMMEGAKDTQKMVTALSGLLKNSLHTDRYIVPIKEELASVDDYLYIQRTRFGDRLNVKKEVESSLLAIEIPVLTLQPLIENAMTHGLEPKEGVGLLSISVKSAGDTINICVEDDGVGMDITTLQKLQSKLLNSHSITDKGMGLPNVHKRIQLIFGSEFGLSINSIQGKGTKVFAVLPRPKEFLAIPGGYLNENINC